MLGPVLDKIFDDYKFSLRLPSPWNGQDSSGRFTFDYRNVKSPYIGDGYIEFYIFGELVHADHRCALVPDEMTFINSEKFSQFVVSESAATCTLNNFMASPIGRIELNTDKVNQLFYRDDLRLDTDFIFDYMPVFRNTIGKKSLQMVLNTENIKVLFGQFDSDVILEYDLIVEFFEAASKESLIKDKFNMITTLDLRTEGDIVFINLLNMKVDSETYGEKTKPLTNGMDLSSN